MITDSLISIPSVFLCFCQAGGRRFSGHHFDNGNDVFVGEAAIKAPRQKPIHPFSIPFLLPTSNFFGQFNIKFLVYAFQNVIFWA